jgi:hypothetical protein
MLEQIKLEAEGKGDAAPRVKTILKMISKF